MSDYEFNRQRDVLADKWREKPCRLCKWTGWDPDGNYCGHRISLAESGGFGRSLHVARSIDEFCGPDGILWEELIDATRT